MTARDDFLQHALNEARVLSLSVACPSSKSTDTKKKKIEDVLEIHTTKFKVGEKPERIQLLVRRNTNVHGQQQHTQQGTSSETETETETSHDMT